MKVRPRYLWQVISCREEWSEANIKQWDCLFIHCRG